MKPNNLWKVYFGVFLLSVAVIAFSSAVFINTAVEEHNTLDNLISFVAGIFSILIALLAYHISVKTYVSIDAVNAMSRMDGNVMEAENYRTNIFALMRQVDATDRAGACNQLLRHLEDEFRGSTINSGAKLADNIQGMIDIIVLFSFVIRRGDMRHVDPQVMRIENLISMIERKVAGFEMLSEGSCILLRESVKLLKAVYNHQFYTGGHHKIDGEVSILDVRGAMLKNSISRTIYYNYMGLLFLSKAVEKLNVYLESDGSAGSDAFAIGAAPLLRQMPGGAEKDLTEMYLRESADCLARATEASGDELLWGFFIYYNKARVEYLLSLIVPGADCDWRGTMSTAVTHRTKLVYLLDDIMGRERRTFFQRAFGDQLKMASMMQMRMSMACGAAYGADAEPADIGADEFGRLGAIRDDIAEHLGRVGGRNP